MKNGAQMLLIWAAAIGLVAAGGFDTQSGGYETAEQDQPKPYPPVSAGNGDQQAYNSDGGGKANDDMLSNMPVLPGPGPDSSCGGGNQPAPGGDGGGNQPAPGGDGGYRRRFRASHRV
ncbi:hypothetical protein ANCCAN_19856 [Ancylostoma caninum]|uniref:Uncharacterized protein n=1 Tax=Ancylostoma caninum TaxID=29170 RepID=A0A368FQF7_ANCCA|nr:hypothetical protein ANCCAN_19856 [Ancylostoma caninum]